MYQDKNGVDVPWGPAFESAAERYPLLRLAIDMWFERVDGPGTPDAYEAWAGVSCAAMMNMAHRLDAYHPNRNPLSSDLKR